jgi:hypothetical protein
MIVVAVLASILSALIVIWLVWVISLLLRLLGFLLVGAIGPAVLLGPRANPKAGAADKCELDETHVDMM